jgi:hypothetical protein
LLKGLRLLTAVILTDAVLDLLSCQESLRLRHVPLAMDSVRASSFALSARTELRPPEDEEPTFPLLQAPEDISGS